MATRWSATTTTIGGTRDGRARRRARVQARADARAAREDAMGRRAAIGVAAVALIGGKRAVARAEEEEAATATPTPRGTENALDAYEMATRSGGNSSTAKAIVNKGEKKSKVKIEAKEASSGPPGALLGAIPVVLGLGGFAAFKSLSGGSSADDDDDDEPIRPPSKKPSLPKFEAPKVVPPKFDAPKIDAPKFEVPKIDAPKFEVPKFEMPKIPGVGGSGLPPDAPRAGFPSRAESFAEEEEEQDEADEEEEEADEEARKARREARRAEREAERAERDAEREAAKAQRAAEREAAEAERAQAKEAKARERERIERDRSAEERDAAERKEREKQLIEQERERIKAEKRARAEQRRAARDAEKAEREAERAAREAERQAEKEARAAERADRKAANALLRSKPKLAPEPKEPKEPKEEKSFTQLFAKKNVEDSEPLAKTQVMKKAKPEPIARTQVMAKSGKSSGVAGLPTNFPSVEDLEGLTKEEKLAIADEADAFAERLVRKAEAAETFANGPVVGVLFFLKPGAIKSAERAAEVAELAEATAAQVRSAAERGDGVSGVLVGAIAATVLIGGGAALLGGSLLGGDNAPSSDSKAVTIKKAAAPQGVVAYLCRAASRGAQASRLGSSRSHRETQQRRRRCVGPVRTDAPLIHIICRPRSRAKAYTFIRF